MDKERKLELLVKYDFSAWRIRSENKIGFSSALAGLVSDLCRSLNNNSFKNVIGLNKMEENYGILFEHYKSIDFSELDEGDEDFKFFFDYGEKLVELGQEINNFSLKILEGKKYNLDKAFEIIFKDMKKMDYRKQVLEKHGITYSNLD